MKNRRQFIGMTAATLASGLLAQAPAASEGQSTRIKAIAFDAFAIFDPRPVFRLAEQLFPARGVELSARWQRYQFEYTWLRNSMGRYVDFWHVTGDALKYAAAELKIDLSSAQSSQLMSAYLGLKPWPDVVPVLQILKRHDIRLALLSNLTPMMLQSCVQASGLEECFAFQLSTDRVNVYKPDPLAYKMGLEAFAISREQVAFVAFAGWDAMGAKSFGYQTYWANRLALPVEELGMSVDATHESLSELPKFIAASRPT